MSGQGLHGLQHGEQQVFPGKRLCLVANLMRAAFIAGQIKQNGMDIGRFGDCRCVAEYVGRGLGDRLDGDVLCLGQGIDRGNAALPCPEILGGKGQAQCFLDVRVYILRRLTAP